MEIIKVKDFNEIFLNKEIGDILSLCVFNPTQGKLQNIAQSVYAKTQGQFYICTENDQVVGILGGMQVNRGHFIIKHIAVHEDFRKKRVASQLIDYLLLDGKYDTLEAETDKDAFDFYKAYGFKCKIIKENNYDTTRYTCDFNAAASGKY